MKLWLFLTLILIGTATRAQTLTYRGSDPFVFCTQGQIDPGRCWTPIQPYTGGTAFVISTWCEPYPYGKAWSADDVASMAQYQTVCPIGRQPGGWNYMGGSPEFVPGFH